MSSFREKVQAITKAAGIAGKTREQTLIAIGHTLGLQPGEFIRLRAEFATSPEPLTPAQAAERQCAAEAATANAELQREVRDARAIQTYRQFRELKCSNPFAAAQLMNARGFEISRGKALDTDNPDNGPQAA